MIWKTLKKWAFAAVAMALAVVICTSVSQAATVDDLTFALNSDGESYYVSYCKSSASGDLVIPATYKGKAVTRIGKDAFREHYEITSVTIPASVIYISMDAFSKKTESSDGSYYEKRYVTLKGYKDTYAEIFAQHEYYTFEEIK